jgi:hypothetical protein
MRNGHCIALTSRRLIRGINSGLSGVVGNCLRRGLTPGNDPYLELMYRHTRLWSLTYALQYPESTHPEALRLAQLFTDKFATGKSGPEAILRESLDRASSSRQ